ncbi:MAG: NAD(P)/FAD-dependent oxidoreductase [Micromonosporaceae bacterium]
MIGGHAVVLGASMGGLLAARVLADHYRSVTVLERDELPYQPDQRRGVPQGRHGHTLLPEGCQRLEQLFPGILGELEQAGVPVLRDDLSQLHFCVAGYLLNTRSAPAQPVALYLPSRPHLEWRVRGRVRALPNVRLVEGCDVTGLIATPDAVAGVRTGDGELPADLVVDAMGRGARTPAWLEQLGHPRPPEHTVKVDVTYATQLVRLPAGALHEKLVLISATPERPTGLGLFRHEDDTWEFTIFGMAGRRPPTDPAAMVDFVEGVAPAHVVAALRGAEQLAEVARHRFPASRWRRYDRMRRLPYGLIAFGDAVCSLNPTFGQGMTVATLQAVALADALRATASADATASAGATATASAGDLPRRFFRAAARHIDVAWRLGGIADRRVLGAQAVPLSLQDRIASATTGRFLWAASYDAALAERFLRVFGLVDPMTRLRSPRALLQVARAHLRKPPTGYAEPRPVAEAVAP